MTRAGLANQDMEFVQFHPTGELRGRGTSLSPIPSPNLTHSSLLVSIAMDYRAPYMVGVAP